MSKFGGLFARKAGLYDNTAAPTPTNTTPPDNPLELDEELFSALGAQLGGENESLRNLLLDANAKIGELDTIKNAVGRLVDPGQQGPSRIRSREIREDQPADGAQQYANCVWQVAQ